MTTFPGLRMITALSVRNFGGLKFVSDNGSYPVERKPEYDLGISFTPFDGFLFRNIYEINIKDLNSENIEDNYCYTNKNTSGCSAKKIHIGTEFGFWPFDTASSAIAFRFGLSQGQPTMGFELNPLIFFKALTIQYAEYTIDTGEKKGDLLEKRKLIQINLGF